MGKHFSAEELDSIQSWKAKGLLASGILRKLQIARRRKHMTGPNMKSVRRALTGKSFKRTAMETRGRKVNVFAAVIGGRRLQKWTNYCPGLVNVSAPDKNKVHF